MTCNLQFLFLVGEAECGLEENETSLHCWRILMTQQTGVAETESIGFRFDDERGHIIGGEQLSRVFIFSVLSVTG